MISPLALIARVMMVVMAIIALSAAGKSIDDGDVISHGQSTSNNISRKGHLGKILFPLMPLPGSSHEQQTSVLSSALVEKGYTVHLLGTILNTDSETTLQYEASEIIIHKSPVTEEDCSKLKTRMVTESNESGVGLSGFWLISQVLQLGSTICRGLFSDTDTIARLKNEGYRLLVADVVFPCDILLARHLNIPFIAYTTSRDYPFFGQRFFGFPSELSYVPEGHSGLTDKMSFLERVKNAIHHFVAAYIIPSLLLGDFVQIQNDFNIDTETNLLDMMGEAMLWLAYSDLSLDFPQPKMPNYVPVGGLASKDAKNLTKELEDFVMKSGDHGVVVFSLGSVTGNFGNENTTRMIASVFKKLDQQVIWRHDGPQPANLGHNTKILKWIPQNDLLGHSKTRLFIGHGGLNGVYEALYHAVPMILIPLMSPDQWDNAARVVSKGMGLQLDSKTIREESFYEAVTEVLNNQKYQQKVSYYSDILRDLPPAKDRAVFWIEHVMKFGGDHLRAHVFELNLIQYYLIDVAAFFLVLAIVLLLVVRCTCGLCCRICKRGKKKVE